MKKFDFVVGNPPYQEDVDSNNETYSPPIYHDFLNNAFNISHKVLMITPARFLFNAGATPKSWNKKMLNDPHFKVLYYEQNSNKIFSNTDIKGGVTITYRDDSKNFGKIDVFSPYKTLMDINSKVSTNETNSITNIIFTQNRFNLSSLYNDYPEFENVIGSNGKDKRFRNNIFQKINIFYDENQNYDCIRVIGVINNKRVWRYIDKKYVDTVHDNLSKWKVIVPRANGKGLLGETLSTPIVIPPNTGYTQTFIGIGSFDNEKTANNLLKYIKTKFLRALLSILKIDQHNERSVWSKIPLQDFTENSDIDWTKSIPEIDQQLYKKYGLSPEEINFIEEKVQEME